MGRPAIHPSVYDETAILALCNRLIAGESMGKACRNADCPSAYAVYNRMAQDEAFQSIIARARVAQQDAMVDGCIDMADAATPEDWQVVKLRIWTRQWQAAKLNSKKYGEKVQMDHSGTMTVRNLTDDQLAARLAELTATPGSRNLITSLDNSRASAKIA